MFVHTLCSALRRVSLGTTAARCYSTQLSKNYPSMQTYNPFAVTYSALTINEGDGQIKFAPRSLNIDFGLPVHNGIKNRIIETPFQKKPSFEDPMKTNLTYGDVSVNKKSLKLPMLNNILEKRSESMIVIRRRKMKKHKLRKARKRMQVVMAKIRIRRQIKREKMFEEELLAKINEAEKFDAKAYVAERLQRLHKEYVPLTYRGELLPKQTIVQFLKERQDKKEWAARNKPKLIP